MAALSITATAVIKSSQGSQNIGVLAAGVTVTQGQALYQLTAGTFGLADANGASPINTFAGIALSAGSPGQSITYCASDAGAFILGASGMTVGMPIWLAADSPGTLTQTFADMSGDTATSVIVGNCLSATTCTIIQGGAIGGVIA